MTPTTLKILLFEDNPDDVFLVKEYLGSMEEPFTLTHVKDREDFFAEVERSKYDIVLCDYSLPNYDGFAAFKYMKQKGINIPFILISGTLTDEMAAAITKSGIDDYLLKDRLSRLPQAIRKILDLRARIAKSLSTAKLEEKKYKLLAEHADELVTVQNTDGIYTDVSQASYDLLGYLPSELKGTPANQYIHPYDVTLFRRVMDNLSERKKEASLTVRMRKKNEEYIEVEHTVHAICDPFSGSLKEVVMVSKPAG